MGNFGGAGAGRDGDRAKEGRVVEAIGGGAGDAVLDDQSGRGIARAGDRELAGVGATFIRGGFGGGEGDRGRAGGSGRGEVVDLDEGEAAGARRRRWPGCRSCQRRGRPGVRSRRSRRRKLNAPADVKAAARLVALAAGRAAETVTGVDQLSFVAMTVPVEVVSESPGLARVPVRPKAPRAGPAARRRSLRVPLPGVTTKPMIGADVGEIWRRVEVLSSLAPVEPTS
jgi:hypothetical protein